MNMACLTCFQSLTSSGISSMAFLRFSRVAFIVLSHLWPLTFWPSPVPLTLSPFSSTRCSLTSVDFLPGGSKASIPCCLASFTRSACLRRPIAAPFHRPVSGFRHGRNGFGGVTGRREGSVLVVDSVKSSLEVVELVLGVTTDGGAASGIDGSGCESGTRKAVRVEEYEAPVYLTE